jgi:hypothetical protein
MMTKNSDVAWILVEHDGRDLNFVKVFDTEGEARKAGEALGWEHPDRRYVSFGPITADMDPKATGEAMADAITTLLFTEGSA